MQLSPSVGFISSFGFDICTALNNGVRGSFSAFNMRQTTIGRLIIGFSPTDELAAIDDMAAGDADADVHDAGYDDIACDEGLVYPVKLHPSIPTQSLYIYCNRPSYLDM